MADHAGNRAEGAGGGSEGAHGDAEAAPPPDLEAVIRDGLYERWNGDRSRAVFWVCCAALRQGWPDARIARALLDRANRISDHIYDQNSPVQYARRQIRKALATADFARINSDIVPSQNNIRLAMRKLGVTVTYDEFAARSLIDGLPGYGPTLDDDGLARLWLGIDAVFHFRPSWQFFSTVIIDAARQNAFHPVRDHLGGLTWDGVPRLDDWLIRYAGAEDTPYVRAVGRLILIAAVRRVRQPGCKFDEMLVLESAQGLDKSSMLATLAVNADLFSDDLPLNVDAQRTIERTQGKWLVEAAELSGMRKGEVESLKAFLSRQRDRARMAYGRVPVERPRQFIAVGTTNNDRYLKDQTGNRRFWPVRVGRIDLDALARDRDQLWAEAAAAEAAGASIRLDPALWGAAADEQSERRVEHPWLDVVSKVLGDMEGRIAGYDVWRIVGVPTDRRTQQQNADLGMVMRELGWTRPKGGVRIDGKVTKGYTRGDPTRRIVVSKSGDDTVEAHYEDEEPTM